MNQGFNEDKITLMYFNTPATTHNGIVCNQETDVKIPYNLQKRYSSGVELLLYLVKHSRPELYNAVRELSKYVDKANMTL